jgi:hypothetical protein
MDNSSNLSSSLLQSSEASSFESPNVSTTSTSSEGFGFLSGLRNINMSTWIIIILILAFLGFNIFVYLAKGTQDIANFFGPIFEKIFGVTLGVTGDVVDVAAQGTKTVVNATAGVIDTGLNAIQTITPNLTKSSIQSQSVQNTIQQPDVVANNSLNKALNTSQIQQESNQDYQAHEAPSSVHLAGKAGWCYVGEDRGFRTCAQVGVNDECMSGDIFPSNELCINPNLRA